MGAALAANVTGMEFAADTHEGYAEPLPLGLPHQFIHKPALYDGVLFQFVDPGTSLRGVKRRSNLFRPTPQPKPLRLTPHRPRQLTIQIYDVRRLRLG